ncbi:unnamed protein product [Caenorhabditis sp. 36 PRJEB53466]|nr:unnamed protein product [Caenorhabditis sp. 36 PRJEB53466]
MLQMEAERDGPHIEEVVDSPTRESSVLRNADRFQNVVKPSPKYLAQMQALLAKPGFNENANYMQEMLNILTMQINDWEHDQEVYGYSENLSQSISQWKSRRERYAQKIEAALKRYYEQKSGKDDSGRREQVRRHAEMTDMNITDRASRTRLHNSNSQRSYNHHNRDYSSDEENEYAGRPPRRRSPSPNGTYLSNSNHQRRDQSYFQKSYHSKSSQNRRDESRAQKSYQSSQKSREGTSRMIIESEDDDEKTDGAAGPSTVQPRKPVRVRVGKSRVTKAHNRKWKPGQKAMMEIRKYQKSTDLLIQKAPFCRLVHEIMSSSSWFRDEFRIRADALLALQEAAEAFLVECFEGSNMLAGHAKRVTLTVADIQLYRRLCLRNL